MAGGGGESPDTVPGHFRDRIHPAGSSRLLASSNFAHQYPTHTHQGLTRDTVHPARPLLECPGTKLALLARFWGIPVKNSPCSPASGVPRYKTRPARTTYRPNRYKTRPACHKTLIWGHFARAGRFFHAWASNRASRAKNIPHQHSPSLRWASFLAPSPLPHRAAHGGHQ